MELNLTSTFVLDKDGSLLFDISRENLRDALAKLIAPGSVLHATVALEVLDVRGICEFINPDYRDQKYPEWYRCQQVLTAEARCPNQDKHEKAEADYQAKRTLAMVGAEEEGA